MDKEKELKEVVERIERVRNRLQLKMIAQGFDYETHGGAKVRFKGRQINLSPEVADLYPPIGWEGEIVYTKKDFMGLPEAIQVSWKPWREDRYHVMFHSWAELEMAQKSNSVK